MSKTTFSVVAGVCAMLVGGLPSVRAQAQQPVRLDIVSQPLSDALRELATVSNTNIVFEPGMVNGITAPALKGSITPEEALSRLLSGTKWSFKFVDENTVSLIPRVETAITSTSALLNSQGFGGDRPSMHEEMKLARNFSADDGASARDENAQASGHKDDAQSDRLEEIIVTAQRREESLQDIPISIGVLSGEQLDSSTYTDVNDALRTLPGLDTSFRDSGTGGVQITLRGVSNPDARAGGAGPVAFYVDSVPFGFIRHSVYPDVGGYDLARVEVLNGPQGTLYGANSLNGVIRVLTQDANVDDFEIKARANTSMTEGGGQNYRGSIALNAPLIEGRLAVRAVIDHQDNKGWIDARPVDPFTNVLDPSLNEDNINDSERNDYRLKVRARPTDNLTIDLLAWRMQDDEDAPPLSTDAQTVSVFNPQPRSSEFDVYGIRVAQEFSDFTLSSMTSWLDYSSVGRWDGGPVPVKAVLGTELYSSVFSQEFNLVSTGDSPWRWSAGAFYRDAEDRNYQDLSFYTFAFDLIQNDYTDTSKSYAVYGELGHRFLNDQLDLAVGLRYFHDDQSTIYGKPYNGPDVAPVDGVPDFVLPAGTTVDSDSEAVTPRVVLTWTPSGDQTFYASYSQGFRSGFAQQPNVTRFEEFTPADPDTLTNYEIGAKGDLAEGLSYEAAVFFIDWQDIQQNVTKLVNGLNALATINGESASGPGASLALTFTPTENLFLSANVGWNDVRFESDVKTSTGVVLYAEGTRTSLSPEWTASFTAEYGWQLGRGFTTTTSIAGDYQSARLTPAYIDGTRLLGPDLFHASARLALEAPHNWTASLFVDNLTDEYGSAYADALPAEWRARNPPRTWGVQLEYRFK